MALHIRRSDAAEYVHTGDPSVVRGDVEPIARSWLPAAGQPADATRVRVRPLDVFEFAAFAGASNESERLTAAWSGVVYVDGAACDIRSVDPSIAYSIVELVVAVSTGIASHSAGPLDESE